MPIPDTAIGNCPQTAPMPAGALVAAGLPEDRLATVIGKAATDPLNKADPDSPENRRISILLLREAPPKTRLGRGESSGKRKDPYSGFGRTNTQSNQAPLMAPANDSRANTPADHAEGGPRETHPNGQEAAPNAPPENAREEAKAEKIEPTEKPVESIKAEEPKVEAETPPVEEIEPVDDGEIIDSDLWQRL